MKGALRSATAIVIGVLDEGPKTKTIEPAHWLQFVNGALTASQAHELICRQSNKILPCNVRPVSTAVQNYPL